MISICIAIKNRSLVVVDDRELRLFPKCIASIVEAVDRFAHRAMPVADDSAHPLSFEIVVADWQSDDWPLTEWLADAAAPIPVRTVQMTGGFSRGRGLNEAARASNGDIILFTDADALLSAELFENIIEHGRKGAAVFPVLFSFDSPDHTSGWWRHEGYGNCAMSRKLFELAGGWPEYDAWGKEDDDFFASVSAIAPTVRQEIEGFFHQWHPDDAIWKNRFAERAAEIAHEIEQASLAKQELVAATRDDAIVIIVDEARFGSEPLDPRVTLPFPEADGEYAGAPPNDEAALRELHRLRAMGATHIAFAWMAFWWLDHYAQFAAYLREHYQVIIDNERLIVFDVNSTRDAHTIELEASRERLLSAIGNSDDVTFIRIHGNIGDDLIYAGARQLLSAIDYREISVTHLQGESGDTAIVAGGGGWCGTYHDLPRYLPLIEQRFRRVIIFPSSFDLSIESVRNAISTTKAKVFARERVSYAQIESICDASLAFDTAFFFDYRPYMRRGRGTLVSYREDREARGHAVPDGNNDISDTCESLDEWMWTIARHESVCTDRAHVMIAAALLGKSVEYRSSNYHKVPSIAEYSLEGFPVSRREIDAPAIIKRGDANVGAHAASEYNEVTWTRRSVTDITALVPPTQKFILVDDEQLRYALGSSTTARHFLERDGQHFGAPSDSDTAIRELEAMRAEGVTAIVFAWPSFWWLDHYTAFADHLRSRYDEVLHSERLIAFDLSHTRDDSSMASSAKRSAGENSTTASGTQRATSNDSATASNAQRSASDELSMASSAQPTASNTEKSQVRR